MVAQKSFWTLMVRKIREEIGELPPQLHKAMMEPGARTSGKFGKRRDWKRRKVGLKLRFRQYCFRGQAVLENVWFAFDVSGELAHLKSEEINV